MAWDAWDTFGLGYAREKLLEKGFSGIKTGITPNAGPCLSSMLKDENASVIVTLLNCKSIEHRFTEAEKLAAWEHARQDAVYELDDTIRTNSRSSSTGVINCSALLSVTVGDTTAQKQVDFKIEPTTNGKTSVSVSPFLF